ncbi:MAG: PspC domain-containing protein [Pseudomonadota bacterium]
MAEEYVNKIRKHIRLDKETGWILGVCAGLASYWRIDTAIVRVGATIAALFFPKIVIASYLVAWLLLDDRSVSRD